ncbi:farnesol dehydrogenase-like [Harmonia axyridis]|uniref:farnesol dehydrogenase-like n=1 Tax=Harmonia axyridis TaxID=115357 RepID=UPI001E275D55|nr:farnesol dehydrogenase-like [Harmonia axyridis]XP_045483410.1 farnesol dehydrogenase-like [Harmonia axyridis]
MERMVGKVAVVTGASSGIGEKIAEMLVKNGMTVIGLARRYELVEKLSKKLQNETGKLYPMKVDITNDDELVETFREIEKKFEPIHVLINNAGLFPPGSLITGSTELWRKVMDTNVMALCIASREAIQIMKKNNIDGQIININSVAGHKIPHTTILHIYPASKYAVTALTESLRLELTSEGSKIRMTSISPGAVRTEPMLDVDGMDMPLLNPEDVANAAQYVLSTPPHVQIAELTIKCVGETIC